MTIPDAVLLLTATTLSGHSFLLLGPDLFLFDSLLAVFPPVLPPSSHRHHVCLQHHVQHDFHRILLIHNCHTVELKNVYVLGFIICKIFTAITLQGRVGIFIVIPGHPRRANGDSQHLEARPELQDWLQFKLFTVKNCRTGPFSK